jgi:hypothetical protein
MQTVAAAPTNKSYLVFENVLKAVSQTGADAVHPGYGFLSENSKFSKGGFLVAIVRTRNERALKSTRTSWSGVSGAQ